MISASFAVGRPVPSPFRRSSGTRRRGGDGTYSSSSRSSYGRQLASVFNPAGGGGLGAVRKQVLDVAV